MSKIVSFIKTRPVLTALIGGAVLLAGASAVSAQYGGGWGGGWRGHHGGPGMMGRGARLERFCSMDTARWQPVMRAYIKADLNLNPAQSTEFDKLVDMVHPAMDSIRAEVCGSFGPNAPKVTAPERLEKAASAMHKAADAMDKAVAPAKSFYNTLDDKQKARVEQLMDRRRMGRGGHGGWGEGRQWGGHGMGMGRGQMGQQDGPSAPFAPPPRP